MFLMININIEKRYFYVIEINKGHKRMSQWLAKYFAIKISVHFCHYTNRANQGLNWWNNNIKPLE